MEQGDRSASRSQHVLYVAPRSTVALERAVLPALERIDVTNPSVQLLVVVPDAETALVAADLALALGGAQGIELVPVTSAGRAARMLSGRPVHAVAAPVLELRALLERSALKLDAVRTVVLAWPDDPAASGPEADAALETVMSDIPRDAARIMLVRRVTPRVEELVERYMRNARRIGEPATAEGMDQSEAPALRYVVAPRDMRPVILRQLLDELDPPSAVIVTRTANDDVAAALTRLGYRGEDSSVHVARYGDIPPAHTIVLYDLPATPGELGGDALADAVQVVAIAPPREIPALRELAPRATPLALTGTLGAARERQRALHRSLADVLAREYPARELLALEPLLDRYDPLELAAAAVRLLEREQESRAASVPSAPAGGMARPTRPSRSESGPPVGDVGPTPRRPHHDRGGRERGPGGRRPGGPGGPGGRDREARVGHPPRGPAGDRRGFGDRPPRRDDWRDRNERGDRTDRSDRGDRGPRGPGGGRPPRRHDER